MYPEKCLKKNSDDAIMTTIEQHIILKLLPYKLYKTNRLFTVQLKLPNLN